MFNYILILTLISFVISACEKQVFRQEQKNQGAGEETVAGASSGSADAQPAHHDSSETSTDPASNEKSDNAGDSADSLNKNEDLQDGIPGNTNNQPKLLKFLVDEDGTLTAPFEQSGTELANLSVKNMPSQGELQVSAATGEFTYKPKKDYFGNDTFTATGIGNLAWDVQITVTPVNDGPSASAKKVTTAEDTPVDFFVEAKDIDSLQLQYDVALQTAKGTLEIIDAKAGMVRFTPNANANGKDQGKFVAKDENLASTETIDIEILPVVDAPVAVGSAQKTPEDTPIAFNLPFKDIDGDGNLTFAIKGQAKIGTVSVDPATGAVSYVPNSNANGLEKLEYSVTKGLISSNFAALDIMVDPVNDAPTSEDLALTTRKNTKVAGKMKGADIDSATLTFKISAAPTQGTLTKFDAATGDFEYTPNANYYGNDTFKYAAFDGTAESTPSTVSIKIKNHKKLIDDNFERSSLYSKGLDFGWRTLIEDNGSPVVESQNDCLNNICAKIFATGDYQLGPMGEGNRSLLFAGREGSSIHSIHLTSKEFDISTDSLVTFKFRSITFDIGDKDESSTPLDEHLKVQICVSTPALCGISPIDSQKLADTNVWKDFYVDPIGKRNNGFNGRNHNAQDWMDNAISLDLAKLKSDFPGIDLSKFSFRFSSRLQDGFDCNQFSRYIEDAVGLDAVMVEAFE